MNQEDKATLIIFKIISTALSIIIIAGVSFMSVTTYYSEWIYWVVLILGFMLNFLLAAYYLPIRKKRGLVFGALSVILGLMLLDKLLLIINI